MREIKFRGWMVGSERMLPKVTDVSSPVQSVIELMQYTGLKDKNGKEIYEGDLIKDSESIRSESVYEVVYHFGGFTIKDTDSDTAKPASNDWFKAFVDKCEVVGNVWES